MKIPTKYTAPILGLALATTSANAALVLIELPGTGTTHANWTTADGTDNRGVGRSMNRALNDSGMTTDANGQLVHSTTANHATNTNNSGTAGVANAGALFDLGSTQEISLMQIWNNNTGGFNHNMTSFSMMVATSSDAVTLLDGRLVIADATLFTTITTNTAIDEAPRTAGYLGETFTFGSVSIPSNLGDESGTVDSLSASAISARYVFLGDMGTGSNRQTVGISEIQFYAIPEPTTALLGGLGLLALLRRRR